MTTKSVPSVKTDRRGTNPRSLANLRPWKPGENPTANRNPYPISRHLKDLLRDAKNGREVAEKMLERAKILTGKSDSAILAQLLDRTEGKIPDTEVNNYNDNRTVNVIVASEQGKQALESLRSGKLPQPHKSAQNGDSSGIDAPGGS